MSESEPQSAAITIIMSQRTPRPRGSTPLHTSSSSSTAGIAATADPAPPAASSSPSTLSYPDLRSRVLGDESESDDEIDPRWTHPKVRAQIARGGGNAAAGGGTSGRGGTGARTSFSPPTRSPFRSPHSSTTSPNQSRYSGIPVPHVDLTGMTDEQRELLEYYQSRIDAFERERIDFLQRLDDLSGSAREKHQLKWEVRKKDEQIMELQKSLSDAHVFLYEERAQVLKLTAENDRLKIQELEDRRRLEHLLALTQPVNQEVTYFRECRPEKLTKNYPGSIGSRRQEEEDVPSGEMTSSSSREESRRSLLNASVTSGTGSDRSAMLQQSYSTSQLSGSQTARSARGTTSKKNNKLPRRGAPSLGSGSGTHRPVVRTIYLPNENIEILKQIIASLRSQLSEQHALFEQRIQALQEDRAIREQETQEVQQKANQHIEEMSKEIKAVNDLNKMTTRDYLELRHAAQQTERKLKERASQLSQREHDLHRQIKELQAKAARAENDLQNENQTYVSLFRQQTAATEEDLAIMKAQYAATQDLYEKRIRYLEGRVATLKTKLKSVEERRALELEGYTTDICQLREKLRRLEQVILTMKSGHGAWMDRESVATTSPDSASSSTSDAASSSRGRARSRSRQRSNHQQHQPARVSAQFAILDDDVHQLQKELTNIARKISKS